MLENWRSIRTPQRFDMTASRERGGVSTLATLPPMYKGKKVLPLAAIYGPNASGKTNMVEALIFIRYLVLDGVQVDRPIPVDTCRTDSGGKDRPFVFDLEILIDGRIYRYGASVGRKEVYEEHLALERTRSDCVIFKRERQSWAFAKEYDTPRMRFIAEGTRSNQLFLHNAVSQNSDEFRPVYDWFSQSLAPIGLEAQYSSYYSMLLRDDFREFIGDKLRRYQTGAVSLELDVVPKESIGMPGDVLEQVLASIDESGARYSQLRITSGNRPEIYVIDGTGEEPQFQKVRLGHRNESGETVEFDLSQESTGTQRLIELLPMLFDLASSDHELGRVYVVDELDRSFHTALTDDLIRTFLACCSGSTRNQLIFTTHDLLLMEDRDIRRDEQWVFENPGGRGTTFTCIGRHKAVRTDTDLLKAYREGVFGGFPKYE